jgi:SAM-dependent MidA family methyltransferase
MHEISEIIRGAASQAGGVLPFARFMELALYHPEFGYYERHDRQIGRSGDFFTSVSVGPLFGQLLAFRLAQTLQPALTGSPRIILAEAGAHDGQLAGDILDWLQENRPALYERVEFHLLEPSPRRQTWQQAKLHRHSTKTVWVNHVSALPLGETLLYSNELLDAFPISRLRWHSDAHAWQEWGVAWLGNRFQWQPLAALSVEVIPWVPDLPEELLAVLPDGFCADISPAALRWWQEVVGTVAQGHIWLIDYGYLPGEWPQPGQVGGSLRAYADHRLCPDPLANPGGQDLTAHVDFDRLQVLARSAGWQSEYLGTQSAFLSAIAADWWRTGDGTAAIFQESSNWTAPMVRQFQTLVHPAHLGRAFKVLSLSRTQKAAVT